MSTRFVCILLAITTSASLCFVPASRADSDPASLVSEWQELCDTGRGQDALDRVQKSCQANPESYSTHIAASYFWWRNGNILEATEQGKVAVKLSPNNFLALSNLAKMQETLDDCNEAIENYRRAQAVEPENVEPALGIARCLAKLKDDDRSASAFRELAEKKDLSRDSLIMVARDALRANLYDVAATACSTAISNAVKGDDLREAKSLRLLALMRANRSTEARALCPEVFAKCNPDNYETYLRAVTDYYSPVNPKSAEPVVAAALACLNKPEDADGLYRLGRIFQDKSSSVFDVPAKYSSWLTLAEKVFARAVAIDGYQPRFYQALAAVQLSLGKNKCAEATLLQSQKLEPDNPLVGYLLSHVSRPDPGAPGKVRDSGVELVSFSVEGLSCTCHATSVVSALTKISGVPFAEIHALEDKVHLRGILIMDPAMVSQAEIWTRCQENLSQGPKMKSPTVVKFTETSSRPIRSWQEIVAVAHKSTLGDVLHLYNPAVNPVEPVLPISSADKKRISER